MLEHIDLHRPVSETPSDGEELDIPLDISDIIEICQEYNALGFQLQSNLQSILEDGVEVSIASGKINPKFVPFLIGFFDKVSKNVYLGDSAFQARQLVEGLKRWLAPVSPKSLN
jgi:hypothetical protein